jgi:hypothetical protein
MAFAGLEDLQGTTEIVIFPRTWKQVEAICQPDKILLVRGKVDGSGKQPKVLAESITDQISIAQPAQEATAVRPVASAPPPRPKPTRLQEPEPVWNLEPDMPPPPPNEWPVAGAESPLTQARRLTITLARSNDQARDMQLLSEAHRLLTSRQGRDRFTFRVTGAGNGAYEIDFPNHYTRFSPDLVGALEKMLGSGTVRVEMQ